MANTAFAPNNAVVKSAVDTAGFVPEVWSDEIVAAYKKNLVAANLIKKMRSEEHTSELQSH